MNDSDRMDRDSWTIVIFIVIAVLLYFLVLEPYFL